ncbi:autophagy-related protein 2 homolog A-like [Ciconia boyciana]|uniref:autophagy-related protein 2 homolog A-like n=1 Tax=Ciconia boyciana TaxID=52775 RepID=UPI003BA2C06F
MGGTPGCLGAPGRWGPPGLEPLADEDPDSESPVYFREFRFTAEVPIWLDYRGKRVTMEQGALAGILIGLARLNCSQLRLKRLCHRQGLLGLGKVLSFAVTEWLRDIRCHQLPGLLGGVAPVHAVLRLWRALRDLLALPLLPLLGGHPGGVTRGVTQGVTWGVTALGAASASAAIGLGTRLLRALQALAEALYELVAPPAPPAPRGPPESPSELHQRPPGGSTRRSPAPEARGVPTPAPPPPIKRRHWEHWWHWAGLVLGGEGPQASVRAARPRLAPPPCALRHRCVGGVIRKGLEAGAERPVQLRG